MGETMFQKPLALFLMIQLLLNAPVFAKKLEELGKRPSTCENLERDAFRLTIDRTFRHKAMSLVERDKLTSAVVANPDCFRVGTEVLVYVEGETMPFLGRALLKKINIMSPREVQNSQGLDYSKSDIKDYIDKTEAKQYGLLTFKMTQKVAEIEMNQEYDRLPTCFVSFNDWRSMRLKSEQTKLLKDIKQGNQSAIIWNGTYNCYKVGVYTEIQFEGDPIGTDHGWIVPTELHVVHLSNLSAKHARLVGESLPELRTRLEANQQTEGGYLTLVAFEYQKKHPKDFEDLPLAQ
jgi:hypothetical protein